MNDPVPPMESMQLRLSWQGADALPGTYANQALVQYANDEIHIVFGQVTPPVLLGDDDERRAQAARITDVAVKPMGRTVMSLDGADSLLQVLARTVAMARQAQARKARSAAEDRPPNTPEDRAS